MEVGQKNMDTEIQHRPTLNERMCHHGPAPKASDFQRHDKDAAQRTTIKM